MQDLNDLYYFVKAVEYGGFAPAGRALCIPKSKLSRRIAALEERLDTRQIRDGNLIKLLDGWNAPPEIIHVVFPSRRGILPSVRALIDFLAVRFASFEEE